MILGIIVLYNGAAVCTAVTRACIPSKSYQYITRYQVPGIPYIKRYFCTPQTRGRFFLNHSPDQTDVSKNFTSGGGIREVGCEGGRMLLHARSMYFNFFNIYLRDGWYLILRYQYRYMSRIIRYGWIKHGYTNGCYISGHICVCCIFCPPED